MLRGQGFEKSFTNPAIYYCMPVNEITGYYYDSVLKCERLRLKFFIKIFIFE